MGQPNRAYCRYCRKTLHAHRLSLLKHTTSALHQNSTQTIQRTSNVGSYITSSDQISKPYSKKRYHILGQQLQVISKIQKINISEILDESNQSESENDELQIVLIDEEIDNENVDCETNESTDCPSVSVPIKKLYFQLKNTIVFL